MPTSSPIPAPAPEGRRPLTAAEFNERVLTRRNLPKVDDWIDRAGVFAKQYTESVDGRLTVTGLRIGERPNHVVAKFGDTIVRDRDGKFSVRPADAHLDGLLAEQDHAYYDLDHDSACCPDRRFACRNYLPHGEVTA